MNPINTLGGFCFRALAIVLMVAFTTTTFAQQTQTELVFASADERDEYFDYVLNHIPSLPANKDVNGDCGSSAPEGVEIEQCKRITLSETPIRWDGVLSVRKQNAQPGDAFQFFEVPLSVTIEPVTYYTAKFRGENWLIREVIYSAKPHNSDIAPDTKKVSCPMIRGVDIKAPLLDAFRHSAGGTSLNVLVGFKTLNGATMAALQNHPDFRQPTLIYEGDRVVNIRGCPSLDYNPLTPSDLTFVELQMNISVPHVDRGTIKLDKETLDEYVFEGLDEVTDRFPNLNRYVRPLIEASTNEPNYGLDVVTFTNLFSLGYDISKNKFTAFNTCSFQDYSANGTSARILGGTLNGGSTYGRVYWASEDGQVNSCSGRINGQGFANFRTYMNQSFCPNGQARPGSLVAFCMNVDTRSGPWGR